MSERFILTVKSGLHFGHIKETFGAGAVIEHDSANKTLIIDGRKFDDVRDLDILKRQAVKFPDRAWIVPFSEEKLAEIIDSKPVRAEAQKKPRPGENMKVVKSDEDLTEPIDIKDTQISKRSQEVKEEQRKKVKSDKLEIVRGDETVEERIARLKDKTDLSSKAERARLMATTPAKMPIVRDDSLGAGMGKNATPLNAGQSLPSREMIDAKAEEAKAIADTRKREIEQSRKAGVEVLSENAEVEPSAEATEEKSSDAVVGVEIGDNDADISKDAEIAELKARIAEMEAQNAKPPSIRRPVMPQARKPVGT
jgi:hypothetical protein